MKLLFVKDEGGVGAMDAHPEALPVPLMPKAALALMAAGYTDVSLPIELLDRPQREAIHWQSVDLSRSWRDPPHEALGVEYRGVDLLECCRIQMLGFFQDVLAAEAIVPRLLDRYHPEVAVFARRPSVPSAYAAMHNGSADVFEAVLQWRLRQAGVRVHIPRTRPQDLKLPAGLRTGLARVKHAALRLAPGFAGSEASAIMPPRVALDQIPKDQPIAVGLGGFYDMLVVWPYLQALAKKMGAWPVLVSGSPPPDHTLRSGLVSDESLKYLHVRDIPLAPAVNVGIGQARATTLKALRSERLPEALRNPLLRFQFEHLWQVLVREALDAARRATWLFAHRQVALYLDDYSAGVSNRAWTEVGNLAGVPTATAPHGAVNLVEMHDFNARWSLAWGELGRRNIALGNSERKDRIIVAGDPSMEGLLEEPWCQPSGQPTTILLLTGGFLHQAWTDMDLSKFLNTWDAIARLASERTDQHFIIKTHPGDRDLGAWYRSFVARQSTRNMEVVSDRRLEELLPSALLSVLVGKPGTAGLVSALGRVPFVYLDSVLSRDVPGYRIWNEDYGVRRLMNPDDMAEVIDHVRASEDQRRKLLEENQRFVSLYLQPFRPGDICQQAGLLANAQGLPGMGGG